MTRPVLLVVPAGIFIGTAWALGIETIVAMLIIITLWGLG